MLSYIVRRLLLMIPTFLGTTFLVFMILMAVPNGPYEQALQQIKSANVQSGETTTSAGSDDKSKTEISPQILADLKREHGLDKNIFIRYLIWLGLAQKEAEHISEHPINEPYRFTIETLGDDINSDVSISLQKWLFPTIEDDVFVVYESPEGTDFNFQGYTKLDDMDLSRVGYIFSQPIGIPYTYTIKNLKPAEENSVLLQQYLIPILENDTMVVYESTKGTNIDFEGYNKLEDIDLSDETNWMQSDWETIEITNYYVNLFLRNKGSMFEDNDWEKSDWSAAYAKEVVTDDKNNKWDWGEKFTDTNKNGKYDKGESFIDAGNKNGTWDEGEGFIDENDNKKWDDLSGVLNLSLFKNEGIFTGYLGWSTKHKEDVGKLMWERIHISTFLGITGFLLSYLICIPLGIIKALKHGSKFDIASSALVFIGYSIPAYAFGVLMVWIFASTSGPLFDAPILPSRGWRPQNWEELTMWGKIVGQLKHALLPTLCYTLASFATLTVLMKNSLMENMSQDYVRTAFAKGLKEKTVILKHAVRNSLIPLATGIGYLIGVFLAGSYLIEKVFGIDGIGMLTFKAIGSRDYGIIMGFLVIGTLIRLFGNLLSDLCYAALDPRIRFK